MAGKSVVVAILADTKNFASGMDEAGRTANGFSGILGGIGKATAAALAVAGAAAVGFVATSVKAAAEAEKVAAQTNAVLNSTAGAAGRTADQIQTLAGRLSILSGVDDEVIQSGQNVLLTFTRIQGVNFDRATEAALNLSVAMGTDLNSASLLVGKALNDPVKGMSALSRAGVQLSEDQRALVLQMVAVGDVAGAQAVLLEELNTQFGGSAEAFGRTFEGALGRVQTIFGNLQEKVGGALLPLLTVVLGKVADFLGMLQESTAFTTFIANLTTFANGLLDGSTKLSDLGGLITGGIQKAADWLAGGGITTIVNALVSGREAMFSAGLQVFPAIVDALVAIVPQLATGAVRLVTSLVGVLVKALPVLVSGAVQLFLGIAQGLAAALPSIITSLVGLIPVLVNTLVRLVPLLLQGAIELFSVLIDAVVQVVPMLLQQIVAMLPDLLGAIVGLIPQLLDGAISLFMSLVEALPVILPALIDAVVGLIPVLIETLLGLIPVLIEASISLFMGIVEALPQIVPALIGAVLSIIPKVAMALVDSGPRILDAAGKMFGKIFEAVASIGPRLTEAGRNIVQGLWDGISRAWAGFTSWWNRTVGGVVDTVKSIFGIRSPSRVFAGIGRYVVRGLEIGLSGANRIGSIMAGLTSQIEGGISPTLNVPTGYRSGGSGGSLTVVVQLPTGMPSADAGREIARALEEYVGVGGTVRIETAA